MRLSKLFDLSSLKTLLPSTSSQETPPHPLQEQQHHQNHQHQQYSAFERHQQQQHTLLPLHTQQQQTEGSSQGSSISSKLQDSLSKGFQHSMKLISRAKGNSSSSSSSPEVPKQPDPLPYQQQQHSAAAQGANPHLSMDQAIAAAAGAALAARSASAAAATSQHTPTPTHAADRSAAAATQSTPDATHDHHPDQQPVCVYTSSHHADVAALSSDIISHFSSPDKQQGKLLQQISEEIYVDYDADVGPTATVGPLPGPPTQLQRAVEVSVKVATPVRVLRVVQVIFTVIVGIATIVLASFRVVTRAADSGPGHRKGEEVDCYTAQLGPASYKFSINSLILMLLTCTTICLVFIIPGLARKVAWLAYTAVHTPHNTLLVTQQPSSPSARAASPTKHPLQSHWAQWLLPTTNNTWHVALAIAWVVIFAITIFGTHRYNCGRVGALLALSFLVFGAHVGSALLGWLVRRKMRQLLLGSGTASSSTVSGSFPVPLKMASLGGSGGGVSDVEMGGRMGQDRIAAAAAAAVVSGQCSKGVGGATRGSSPGLSSRGAGSIRGDDECGVEFEEPSGVQPQVVQLLGPNLGLPKTKSH